MAATDFTDCYGSIYTHSIAWALHGKVHAKARPYDKTLLGNKIDTSIREMQNRESIGIPQGSVLMDLIAEIVLGYLDNEICYDISENHPDFDYQILRFRDDYRIFTHSTNDAEEILRIISKHASSVGLRLNSNKTKVTRDIISAAVKPDKRAINQIDSAPTLLGEMLIIHDFSLAHPNSAGLEELVTRLSTRIDLEKPGAIPNATEITAISLNVAVSNPRVFPATMGLMSRVLERVDATECESLLEGIIARVEKMPHNAFVSTWLQRLTRPIDKSKEFDDAQLWDNSWIASKTLREILESTSLINREVESSQSRRIGVGEFRLAFQYPNW
jgi:hypothetical protein